MDTRTSEDSEEQKKECKFFIGGEEEIDFGARTSLALPTEFNYWDKSTGKFETKQCEMAEPLS